MTVSAFKMKILGASGEQVLAMLAEELMLLDRASWDGILARCETRQRNLLMNA